MNIAKCAIEHCIKDQLQIMLKCYERQIGRYQNERCERDANKLNTDNPAALIENKKVKWTLNTLKFGYLSQSK